MAGAWLACRQVPALVRTHGGLALAAKHGEVRAGADEWTETHRKQVCPLSGFSGSSGTNNKVTSNFLRLQQAGGGGPSTFSTKRFQPPPHTGVGPMHPKSSVAPAISSHFLLNPPSQYSWSPQCPDSLLVPR